MASRIGYLGQADFDAVAELYCDFRELYGLPSTERSAAREFLYRRTSTGQATVFVAKAGDDVIGFLNSYHRFDSMRLHHDWLLSDLYVVEKYRHRGLGADLIDAALAAARTDDADRVVIEQKGPDYPRWQAFLDSRGFQCEEGEPRYILDLTIRMA